MYLNFRVVLTAYENKNADNIPISIADPKVVDVALPGLEYPNVSNDESSMETKDRNIPYEKLIERTTFRYDLFFANCFNVLI